MATSRHWRRWFGPLALSGLVTIALSAQPLQSVRDVRFTSETEVTRVVIELSNEAVFHTERIENPDRVFFDLPHFVPRLAAGKQRNAQLTVGGRHIRQIRVAENQPGLTRLVFDMESPDVVFKANIALDPPRLIVEFRRSGAAPSRTIDKQAELIAQTPPAPQPPAVKKPRPFDPSTLSVRPVRRQPVIVMSSLDTPTYPRLPERLVLASPLSYIQPPARPARSNSPKPIVAKATIIEDPLPRTVSAPVSAPVPAPAQPAPIVASLPRRSAPLEVIPPPIIDRTPVPDRSMIRALGLKVSRIVIDPGHGGQDYGTSSASGLHEKELVLDVSRRLATLLRQSLGAEVILTRGDDTFVSLEQRTVMANDRKADLFISVHANSSPAHSAAGIETFYLNFAASPGALEVAGRENSSSRKNVHELNDLLQKIALNAKLDESREFATRVQNALVTGDNNRNRNRGVKRAPFIVLIGADMPAILTEIGFVSNPAEEANLRRPEYRQKLAEQIFNGVAGYAGSLNPMQVAQRSQAPVASADSQ